MVLGGPGGPRSCGALVTINAEGLVNTSGESLCFSRPLLTDRRSARHPSQFSSFERSQIHDVNYSQEIAMDPRWEALSGIVTVALLLVPVFLVMRLGVNRTRQLRESER